MDSIKKTYMGTAIIGFDNGGVKHEWNTRKYIAEVFWVKGETLKKVKISVIEVTFSKERARLYAPEGYGVCELHDVGQIFYSNGWQKPTGLCDNAWNCMRDYVLAISQGAGFIYGDGGFTNREGMVIVACNDGIRPVIFKVESTDLISDTFNEDLSTIKSQHRNPDDTSTK